MFVFFTFLILVQKLKLKSKAIVPHKILKEERVFFFFDAVTLALVELWHRLSVKEIGVFKNENLTVYLGNFCALVSHVF